MVYDTTGTSCNQYSIQYIYTQPHHPGCPGRKHTCPDCGQEYFAPMPYVPQPIWIVPQPNWYPTYPNWYSGTSTITCSSTS